MVVAILKLNLSPSEKELDIKMDQVFKLKPKN